MKSLSLVLICVGVGLNVPAHATLKSWFGALCEKHLITDDPYQFEYLFDAELKAEYLREGARAVWSHEKSNYLRLLGNELRKRPASQENLRLLNDYMVYELTKEYLK